MIMIRSIAGALALGLFASGCSLFQKKEEPAQNNGGGGGGGEQGGGMDPTQFVTTNSPLSQIQTAKLKVGYSANQKMDASGQVMNTSWAVVGEQGNSWLIESVNPAMLMAKGYVMGLTVNKEDGKVTKAVLGKPGEAGKPIKINETPPPPAQKAPEGTNEDVKIKLGTFPSKKYVNKYPGADGKEQVSTSWVGNGGALDKVLLKSDGAGQNYELKEMPEDSQVKVGDTSLTVTKYAYTNDMVMWVATGSPVLGALFPYGDEADRSLFKMTNQGTTMEITEVSTSAKPQLKW